MIKELTQKIKLNHYIAIEMILFRILNINLNQQFFMILLSAPEVCTYLWVISTKIIQWHNASRIVSKNIRSYYDATNININ